ncbi:peptidoglycan editing factor PgeF [uncultured Nitrospira sp.]|uniref:peptidoglycan editing factor PgeF n=1 Tax=uncultured Nitrospira sp. TaxID=157176 RepID=UPI0031404C63
MSIEKRPLPGGTGVSDDGFTSHVIPVRHFFGTRSMPAGLHAHIQLGHMVNGPKEFPAIVALKQIHSTRVVVIHTHRGLGALEQTEGDALVTNQPETLVVVRTADCVPVLLVEKTRGVVAAIHAGWRGAVAGIVAETIRACVDEFGAKPEHMHLAIGPSIGPCCYEVDEQVLNPLRSRYPIWPGVLQETKEGKGVLDLKQLIYHQIRAGGVPDSQIGRVDHCTHCRDDLFYSYRREGQVNGTMCSGIILPAA